MSQINNVLTTTFRAVGGNVVSQLNSYASGFGRLGTVIDRNTQMSSRLNNQWRAIGTTIRYAVAGGAIFGLQRMVSEIAQVNTQLGQMQALTGIGQGTRFDDTQMGQLLNGLMQTSTDTVTPLNDVNDAAINFLSTVQNVKPGQLPQMLSDIGIAARISQASMEDVTQAATTMQIAFGRRVDPRSVGQFSRMFMQLIGVAPGGTAAGSTIAQAMPGLASMFQLAPGQTGTPAQRQAQMMALTQGVLMTGMPAATGMRGLTYLLQSIAQPTGGAKVALSGIGITPEFVQQQGIFAAVMKLLHTISPVSAGQAKSLAAIPEDTLDTTNTLPGIPATEMQALRTMIPRIHGIRAAIILASQLQQRGDVQSIAQDLNDYTSVQSENSQQAKRLRGAVEDFKRRARMQDAAIALHNAGIQIGLAFQPLFDLASRGILGVSHATQRHPQLAHRLAIGGAVFAGALGVARFTGLAQHIPGLRNFSLGQAYVREQALTAAMGRGGVRDGSTPQTSLFVTVVGEVFGNPNNAPPSGGGGGFGGFLKRTGKFLGPGLAGLLGGETAAAGGVVLGGLGALYGLAKFDQHYLSYPMRKGLMWSPTGRPYESYGEGRAPGEFSMSKVHRLILEHARQMFGGNVSAVSGYGAAMWHGQADINMTITRENADGSKTRQRVHVPVDLWAKGKHPSHRGQPKTVRSK